MFDTIGDSKTEKARSLSNFFQPPNLSPNGSYSSINSTGQTEDDITVDNPGDLPSTQSMERSGELDRSKLVMLKKRHPSSRKGIRRALSASHAEERESMVALSASTGGLGASGGMSAPAAGELPFSKKMLPHNTYPAARYSEPGNLKAESLCRRTQVLDDDDDELALESVHTASDSDQGPYDTDSLMNQNAFARRSSYPISVYSSESLTTGWPSPTSSPEKTAKSVGSSSLRNESSQQERGHNGCRANSWGGGASSSLINEDSNVAMDMGMTQKANRATAVGRNSLSFDAPPLVSSLKAEAFDYLATEDIQPYPNPQQQVHKTLSSLQTGEWPEIFHTLNSVSCPAF